MILLLFVGLVVLLAIAAVLVVSGLIVIWPVTLAVLLLIVGDVLFIKALFHK